MSVRLLWHTAVSNDSAPLGGLCLYDDKEMVFRKADYEIYKESKFELYSCPIDQLEAFKAGHIALKEQMGGINDYGTKFRLEMPKIPRFSGMVRAPTYPSDLELIKTITYSDIVNPYQHMK